MSRNQNVLNTIDYVKEKIEWCIQKYMSLEQTMTYLNDHDQIRSPITGAIWEHLRRGNPNFFEEYDKRCELARQIAKFNDLLAQQKDLMQKHRLIHLSTTTTAPVTKLHKPNDHHHDQWFESYDFAHIEDSFPPLIDPFASSDAYTDDSISSLIIDSSPLAATPHSDPFTLFAATPHSDPLTTSGLRYDIDCDDPSLEKVGKDLEEQQQRMQLKVQIQQQPQQEASNNLDFGDGSTNKNNGSDATYDL